MYFCSDKRNYLFFSDNSAELSASAYSEDSENVTPLRKVLFPMKSKQQSVTKKEVHFDEDIEVQ